MRRQWNDDSRIDTDEEFVPTKDNISQYNPLYDNSYQNDSKIYDQQLKELLD